MVYRVIGLMSGSSLDGLDIAYVELQETRGQWKYEMLHSACVSYDDNLKEKLSNAHKLSALDYQLLHTDFGHFIGREVNKFITENKLEYKVQLIASHGHTSFHLPGRLMTAQLGDGAAIAAETSINVVCDLRSMDIALGGHGAPIVPIGEKLLLSDYTYFLNIGGIANLSYNSPGGYIAFDVCPANRVLNLLVKKEGMQFDESGALARSGRLQGNLLHALNQLDYYNKPFPKSLSNSFGTEVIYPMLDNSAATTDLLNTYVEHIAMQVKNAVAPFVNNEGSPTLLVTGGGAHNHYLVERLKDHLSTIGVELVLPANDLVDFKEAIIMAFIGVLRWREEFNVFASVTGARRDSIGGAVYLG